MELPDGVQVHVDPTLPRDVIEVRGRTTTRIRLDPNPLDMLWQSLAQARRKAVTSAEDALGAKVRQLGGYGNLEQAFDDVAKHGLLLGLRFTPAPLDPELVWDPHVFTVRVEERVELVDTLPPPVRQQPVSDGDLAERALQAQARIGRAITAAADEAGVVLTSHQRRYAEDLLAFGSAPSAVLWGRQAGKSTAWRVARRAADLLSL